MNPAIVSFTVCLTGMAAATANVRTLPSGLEFEAPAGWLVNITQQGAALAPPGQDTNSELYVAGILTDVRNLDGPNVIPDLVNRYFGADLQTKSAGQPIPFMATGGRGMVYTFDAHRGLVPLRIHLYLVDLNGKGVAALAAVGRRDLILNRNFSLMAMASSFHAGGGAAAAQQQSVTPLPRPAQAAAATSGSSAAAGMWTQRLSDKKLVYMSSYSSSGGSGGYSSEKKIYLAADGRYAFRSSSSVSVYVPGANGGSSGQSQDEGRWRVIEPTGQPVLELTSQKGVVERIALSMNGSQTFLNGRRWFVVGINE